ncbi:MAG: cytochrome c maturation protein CcmE [Taibaiella sp.]|nr:cytochrome c maturation protein CcmE [Taibaiella sp.]
MKKIHIIILLVVAATLAVVLSSFEGFTSVQTFASAEDKPGKTFKIPAFLDTTKAIVYDRIQNPNEFSFHAVDKKGNVRKVIFKDAKPTDFERAEQLNMMGFMDGDIFICTSMQMKCPSKYENDQFVEAKY